MLPVASDKEERDLERFFSKVEFTGYCWNWKGPLGPRNYGMFCQGQNWHCPAHRWIYERFHGKLPPYIPGGEELDHKCRNHSCVRPSHLELVSHKENILRGESPMAKNARATHCKRGHEFTAENTLYRKGTTQRQCRKCDNRRKMERYWRDPSVRAKKRAYDKERKHAQK